MSFLYDLGRGYLGKGSTQLSAQSENSLSTPPQLKSTLAKNKRRKTAPISSSASQTSSETLV